MMLAVVSLSYTYFYIISFIGRVLFNRFPLAISALSYSIITSISVRYPDLSFASVVVVATLVTG